MVKLEITLTESFYEILLGMVRLQRDYIESQKFEALNDFIEEAVETVVYDRLKLFPELLEKARIYYDGLEEPCPLYTEKEREIYKRIDAEQEEE